MGDKTQLATMALGARLDSTAAVTAGTTLGMLVADGLAVRRRLADRDRVDAQVRRIAAGFFFAFGAVAIAGTAGML